MVDNYTKKATIQFINAKRYILAEDLHIKTKIYGDEYVFIVPKGFRTDMASIPRVFWWILSPTDWSLLIPSIAHDWCYANDKIHLYKDIDGELQPVGWRAMNKRKADNLWKEKVSDFGAWKIKVLAVYIPVYLFGRPHY